MRDLIRVKEEYKNGIQAKNRTEKTNIKSKSKMFSKFSKHGIQKDYLVEKFNNTINIMKAKENSSSVQNINRNTNEIKKDANICERKSKDENDFNTFLNDNEAITKLSNNPLSNTKSKSPFEQKQSNDFPKYINSKVINANPDQLNYISTNK